MCLDTEHSKSLLFDLLCLQCNRTCCVQRSWESADLCLMRISKQVKCRKNQGEPLDHKDPYDINIETPDHKKIIPLCMACSVGSPYLRNTEISDS